MAAAEVTKQNLADKIAQLNAAIDDVSSQVRLLGLRWPFAGRMTRWRALPHWSSLCTAAVLASVLLLVASASARRPLHPVHSPAYPALVFDVQLKANDVLSTKEEATA